MVAAHRDDHPQFEPARRWLDALVDGDARFCVPDLVAGSFVRIVTHPRIFVRPTPIRAAFAYLGALRGHAGHTLLAPGPAHLEIFERLCRDSDAAGDVAADAQLAAIAVEHAAEVISFDRDFARFDGVRWARP